MTRLALACAAASLVLAGAAASAQAHALLRKAVPGVGSTVQVPPNELDLFFSEAVEPSLCHVAVHDTMGMDMAAGPPATASDNPKKLIAKLKPLAAGVYTVEWHAISVDTHKTDGTFTFTVAK